MGRSWEKGAFEDLVAPRRSLLQPLHEPRQRLTRLFAPRRNVHDARVGRPSNNFRFVVTISDAHEGLDVGIAPRIAAVRAVAARAGSLIQLLPLEPLFHQFHQILAMRRGPHFAVNRSDHSLLVHEETDALGTVVLRVEDAITLDDRAVFVAQKLKGNTLLFAEILVEFRRAKANGQDRRVQFLEFVRCGPQRAQFQDSAPGPE